MAFRAGISEDQFWCMTEHSLGQAVRASHETLSRLAYRIAVFNRIEAKRLPRTEDAIFTARKTGPQRQSLKQQLVMARLATQVLSKKVH